MKTTSNPNHPFSKFGTGNLKTLQGDTTRDELIKFHSQYYSSSIMKLCVLGRESLDELENLVVQYFSPIKNLHIKPTFPSNAFNSPDSSVDDFKLDEKIQKH